MHRLYHPRVMLVASMAVFGTIGVFVRNVPVSSGELALYRAVLASVMLAAYLVVTKQPLELKKIRRELPLLLLSGVAMGFNWILLFEAYNHTSVATATLCYYMAPIFVTLAAPLVLGERLTARKLITAFVALFGMVLVSDILNVGVSDMAELRGILLGLGAAALYASVILLNKKLTDISAYDRTVIQLGAAAVVLLPYVLLTENWSAVTLEPLTIILLLAVGVVHTGAAYAMYFGSMRELSAQTVAIFSYIDPILAVILSAVILGEPMGLGVIIGGILILGATLAGELWGESKS